MKTFDVLIRARTREKLRELDAFHLDLKHRGARQEAAGRFVVPALLSEEQLERVKAAGYEVIILADADRIAGERIQEVSSLNRFAQGPGLSEAAALGVHGYLTVEESWDALKNLSSLAPHICTLIDLPDKSWEDRTCHAVRVGLGRAEPSPGVLFTGGMHAREWGGTDICVAFITNLMKSYEQKTALQYGAKIFAPLQVQRIIENLDLFVFPLVNPDGRHTSQTGTTTRQRMWRKNRNPNTGVDPQHPGVDINRNFAFLWEAPFGSSGVPQDDTYKGVAPFSEPETRNVRHFFDVYPNIRYYSDIHSYSELILYAWGDDVNQSEDPRQNFLNPEYDGLRGEDDSVYGEYIAPMDAVLARGIANSMNAALSAVRQTTYTVQQGFQLYPTTGTSSDYAFSRSQADSSKRELIAFTIEFGKEFIPPFADMRSIIDEVCSAMTELCWIAAAER